MYLQNNKDTVAYTNVHNGNTNWHANVGSGYSHKASPLDKVLRQSVASERESLGPGSSETIQ